MDQLNIGLAVVGLTVVAIGLLSNALKKSIFQEPLVAVAVGIAVGPYALGWLDVGKWGDPKKILEQAARLTVAISLMGIALRLKTDSIKILARPIVLLVTVGMVGMWLASSAVLGWMFGLSLWTALLVGAVVTPTDPIVASSIVTGPFAKRNLPLRTRETISYESGANDGLAYLIVMLPVLMLTQPPHEAWPKWVYESLILGVGGAAVVGCISGYLAAKLLDLAVEHKFIEETSFLSYAVALCFFTLGFAELLHMDALISVFLAGVVFNLRIGDKEKSQKEPVQESTAKMFMLPMFAVFGIALPFGEWAKLGWTLLLATVLVLLLRRIPTVTILSPFLRPWLNRNDLAFFAWMGPIGVAALYYAMMSEKHTHDPTVWHIASAVIFGSILAHGLTAAPLTKIYSRDRGEIPPATHRITELEGEELIEQAEKEEEHEREREKQKQQERQKQNG